MVGVDFVDREIERWRYMSRVPQKGSGLDRCTIGGEQQIASINVLSLLPRVVGDIPELVILSRRNRAVADFELDECAGASPRWSNQTSVTASPAR